MEGVCGWAVDEVCVGIRWKGGWNGAERGRARKTEVLTNDDRLKKGFGRGGVLMRTRLPHSEVPTSFESVITQHVIFDTRITHKHKYVKSKIEQSDKEIKDKRRTKQKHKLIKTKKENIYARTKPKIHSTHRALHLF